MAASPRDMTLSRRNTEAYIETIDDRGRCHVAIVDLESATVVKDIPLDFPAIGNLVLSSDERRLYAPTASGVKVIDTARRTIVKTLKADGDYGFTAFLTPRGDLLWVAYADHIAAIQLSTGSIAYRITLTGATSDSPDITFSADGRTAYALQIDTINIIDVATHKVSRHFKYLAGLSIMANGPVIYVAGDKDMRSHDARVATVDPNTGKILHSETFYGRGRHLALSPDKRRLYVTNPDGYSIEVFDTATGRPVHTIAVDGGFPWDLAISADGSTLYVTEAAANALTVFKA
ncbi:YncE family protein [Jatrophihabitans sp.]|uniref:YncE family protein n=1 Tax=Jatrophihabitans sp. TaxID=1932789 RepID=UPI002C386CA7|nr:hypothetical protein [Jatrophihabitans sp.]